MKMTKVTNTVVINPIKDEKESLKKVEDLVNPFDELDRYINRFVGRAADNEMNLTSRHHVCLYCQKPIVKLRNHLITEHPKFQEVSFILNLPVKCEKRKKQLIRLQRIGDFQYNANVLHCNKGELIVLKLSEPYISRYNRSYFVPCPDCVGFVFMSQLESHHKKCLLKPTVLFKGKRKLLEESHALLGYLLTSDREDSKFNTEILNKTYSIFGLAARRDKLITLLGQYMMDRLEPEVTTEKVMLTMRKMGCFILSCQKFNFNLKLSLHQLLVPESVKLIINTVKTLISTKIEDVEKFELINFFYSNIVICVFLWRGKCLIDGCWGQAEVISKFYYDFVEAWEMGVIGIMKVPKNEPSINHEEETLHLTSAVIKLKKFLTSRLIQLTSDIQLPRFENEIGSLWHELGETAICLLCLINPVDFRAIESLTVEQYAVRPDWRIDNQELYKCRMTDILYYLAGNRHVMCTEYRGTEITLLFTHEIKQALDILIRKRKQALVLPENPYVFANRSFDSKSTLSVANGFYHFCAKDEEFINNIMKNKKTFVSHVSQISEMSVDEIKWAKNYLLHVKNYSNLSKNSFAQALKMYNFNEELEKKKKKFTHKLNDAKEHPSKNEKGTKQEVRFTVVVPEEYSKNVPKLLPLDVVSQSKIETVSQIGKWRLRKKWSNAEREYVSDFFKEEINQEKIPGKLDCLQCLSQNRNLLHSRSWISLKHFVTYEIDKRRKILEMNNPLFCDLD